MKTFEEVASARGLPPVIKDRYVKYMRARWANEETVQCATGYAMEWADRFLCGDEMACSDMFGQKILHKMNEEVR